jgi:hypothetical protein
VAAASPWFGVGPDVGGTRACSLLQSLATAASLPDLEKTTNPVVFIKAPAFIGTTQA